MIKCVLDRRKHRAEPRGTSNLRNSGISESIRYAELNCSSVRDSCETPESCLQKLLEKTTD